MVHVFAVSFLDQPDSEAPGVVSHSLSSGAVMLTSSLNSLRWWFVRCGWEGEGRGGKGT